MVAAETTLGVMVSIELSDAIFPQSLRGLNEKEKKTRRKAQQQALRCVAMITRSQQSAGMHYAYSFIVTIH